MGFIVFIIVVIAVILIVKLAATSNSDGSGVGSSTSTQYDQLARANDHINRLKESFSCKKCDSDYTYQKRAEQFCRYCNDSEADYYYPVCGSCGYYDVDELNVRLGRQMCTLCESNRY